MADMKRVYTKVDIEPVAEGFAVTLDGRPVRTPAGGSLATPNRALAEAVAAEWQAQEDEIRPDTMPLTRLAGTAIDQVAGRRAQVVAEIAAYGTTDLLCHRADMPAELVARQNAAWQPLLDWLAERYGARLGVTRGVLPCEHPEDALVILGDAVAEYDDIALTGLHALTAACGSLVLALAFAEGRIDDDDAWRLSRIDEAFQIEKWGEDAEAAQASDRLHDDVRAAARFLVLGRA